MDSTTDKPATRIIAIANQKGGVGKSTTAVSLGAALAEGGERVLVVDLDPQGNASTGLGIRHDRRDVTIYQVLIEDAPLEKAVTSTGIENLYAVPATIDLAGAEIELVSQFSREMRLAKALDEVRDGRFDFVLLDCPPSLGLLTVNALAAARELIVPIQCEYYALEGLGQLLKNVSLVQQNLNPDLRLTGIVMTMFDPRTKLSEQVVEEVKKHFGAQVYDTIIPRSVRLSEAPGFGEPITVYDPKSRGAECYRDLAREVRSKVGGIVPSPPEAVPTIVVAPPPAPEAAHSREDSRGEREPRDSPHVVGPQGDSQESDEPEGVEFETPEELPPAELPADVLVAEATVVVDDLTDVDGIPSADGEASDHPKKRWRLFRKGGEA